jgi:hypothetical protein
VKEADMSERSLSLIMLITIAIFALVILLSHGKPALQASDSANSTTPISGWPSTSPGEITTYGLPLDSAFLVPLATRITFKVNATSGQIMGGSLIESGGGCFTYYVLDEEAYLFLLRNGPGLLSQSKGKVYASGAPAHSNTEFSIKADRTGDYYFVLINPPGSCHGKTVTVKVNA